MTFPSTAKRRVWLELQTTGKRWTMRPHYERRPSPPRVRDPETYHRPAPGTMRQNEEAKAMNTGRAQRLGGTDHWGRTWEDRRAWTRFLRGFAVALLVALPAEAVCPAHQQAFAASPEGNFHLCAAEVDASTPPKPVALGFYRRCDVTAYTPDGEVSTSVSSPIPGATVLVGFPAVVGKVGVTATCTNNEGLTGAISAALVQFRKPSLAAPVPPGMGP